MSNSFFTVSRNELQQMIPQIINNSKAQYDSALVIASGGNPGIGLSHLLISSEEMIKALIVTLDSQGFKFRNVQGMDIFFRHHEIRFFISSIIFAVSVFGEDLIAILPTIKENPQKIHDFLKMDEKTREGRIERYIMRKMLTLSKEIEWFSTAEKLRQNGFYVDVNKELISPINVSKEEFEQARIRIEKVNRTTKYIIDVFMSTDPLMKKEIELTKKTFDENNYYKLIEATLMKTRKDKKSFFDFFRKELFELLTNRKERQGLKKFNELVQKRKTKEVES